MPIEVAVIGNRNSGLRGGREGAAEQGKKGEETLE